MTNGLNEQHALEPVPSPAPVGQPQFHFGRFVVIRASMQELPQQIKPEGEATSSLEIAVAARITVTGEVGTVMLDFVVTPDPAITPYDIQLNVAADFAMRNGTREQFVVFLKNNAPAIVFPYVRHLVDQMTADARYGRVRIDPLNFHALLSPNSWSEAPPLAREPTSPEGASDQQ
ncbi:MAG TPA: protein-export chaperone SecB [Gemmatimonadaceae bacterium]|nr:protein-export chaperone SecB [Gemmatimonadaceae bacterium]